jgi:hypothetical protein
MLRGSWDIDVLQNIPRLPTNLRPSVRLSWFSNSDACMYIKFSRHRGNSGLNSVQRSEPISEVLTRWRIRKRPLFASIALCGLDSTRDWEPWCPLPRAISITDDWLWQRDDASPFDPIIRLSYKLDLSWDFLSFIDKLCEDDEHRVRSSMRLARGQSLKPRIPRRRALVTADFKHIPKFTAVAASLPSWREIWTMILGAGLCVPWAGLVSGLV